LLKATLHEIGEGEKLTFRSQELGEEHSWGGLRGGGGVWGGGVGGVGRKFTLRRESPVTEKKQATRFSREEKDKRISKTTPKKVVKHHREKKKNVYYEKRVPKSFYSKYLWQRTCRWKKGERSTKIARATLGVRKRRKEGRPEKKVKNRGEVV